MLREMVSGKRLEKNIYNVIQFVLKITDVSRNI